MNRRLVIVVIASIFCLSAFCQRQEQVLDEGWKFMRSEHAMATQVNFDDSAWEEVVVPHDYAIFGPFNRDNDLQDVMNIQNKETKINRKTGRTGGLPYYGQAWYRRHFLTKGGKRCWLYFDGAMSEATVFVNGKQVAFQPNGYAAFYVDITPFINKQGKDNVLAVRLDAKAHSSRWYPGAGLFREVRLIETAAAYLSEWDTKVTTLLKGDTGAEINLSIAIQGKQVAGLCVKTELLDSRGRSVASCQQWLQGNAKAELTRCYQQLKVSLPELWSPETPNLYQLRLTLFSGSRKIDCLEKKVGIRTVDFVPQKGFFLNGERRQIQGVCIHHDLGAYGTAVNEAVLRYRLKLLKDMGCNAIRTSHNLPSSLLPKLCDEMGLMLMIEPFDEWDTPKCENGFHRYFADYGELLVRDMVRHFRNHPSVILWGIGNEVPNQRDTHGWEMVKRLQKYCHEEDSTRQVTVCMDQIPYVLANGFAKDVDIPGINYNTWNYAKAKAAWSQGMILGSETASTVSSRGVYKFPLCLRAMAMYDDHQSSGYDVEYCSWSNTPDVDFALAEKYPWYLGQFVWTGFDYLGEPTPYNNDSWPSHSSLFGIVDLANIPKDRYYLYRSQWNKDAHTLHILPHWTWPGREGLITPVMVYTDYPEAELFLNGKSLGRKRKISLAEAEKSQNDSLALLRHYRLIWDSVKYEPGKLEVVAYDFKGRAVMTDSVCTAGKPCRLVATVDKATLKANGNDMAFVRIDVVDKYGNLCIDSNNMIHFRVTGNGQFVASANGDPTDLHPYHFPDMPVFKGQLMAMVRASKQEGLLAVEAFADGLQPCRISLRVK